MSYKVGHNIFDTKKDLKEFYKNILNMHFQNEKLNPDNLECVKNLLYYYSDIDTEQIKDVDYILVQRKPPYYTKAFCAVKKDETEFYFSYIDCVQNVPKQTDPSK